MFGLFAIGSLQKAKDSNITGLELVGGMRGQPTKYNVVLKTKLQDLKGLVSSKAISDKHPWFHIRPLLGLWVKHKLDPLLSRAVPMLAGAYRQACSWASNWPAH
jgi:hypothetical protein